MQDTIITVSDSADYDMFRKTEPSPEAQHYFNSPIGMATCEACWTSWFCHLRAWGSPDRVSRCNQCGGTVRFHLPEKKTNEDHSE